MEIKNIKRQSSGKYQIIFTNGDKIVTYDEVLLKNNLLYKKELSLKEIDDIQKLSSYYDVYNNVVKYISKKMRSIKEIKEYLKKYELSTSDNKRIIDTLTNNGLLNDNRFVRAYIYDKMYLSNDGPYKIKKDLLKNDIDENIIDEELSKISEDEIISKLIKLIEKKIKLSKGSNYIVKQKILLDMQNLGYSKSMIEECFSFERDDSSYLSKEFEKVYKDVSRKETDKNKINLKVKQKLYQKGYSLSEIDKLLSTK